MVFGNFFDEKEFNGYFYVKTLLARLFREKCPQKALQSLIGTWSVIRPGLIKSRSVIGAGLVMSCSPYAMP